MLRYLELTRKHYPIDIAIWPESALATLEGSASSQQFLDLANSSASINEAAIITGIINYNFETREYFNRLLVLGKQESDSGYYYGSSNKYDKNHLLPIGEFVPFEDLLRPLAPFFNLPMSSFTRGDYVQPNLSANGLNFLSLICFEIAFPKQLAANFQRDTDFILTVSNDAWFGASHGPDQHLEIAQMRALEFGRPVLRATNNGLTAVAESNGEIFAIAPQFEEAVLKVDVAKSVGITPYSRFGEWLNLLWLALFSLVLWLRNKRAISVTLVYSETIHAL